MTTSINPDTVTGAEVTGHDGSKLGKVDTLYVDNQTGQPAWAAVKSGMFGNHLSLVPLTQAQFDGKALSVPFDKEQLKTAPHLDPDTELSPQAEQDLYKHYGMEYGQPAAPPKGEQKGNARQDSRRDRAGEPGIQGRDTSGPTTDDAMTRSEEQLHVGTEPAPRGGKSVPPPARALVRQRGLLPRLAVPNLGPPQAPDLRRQDHAHHRRPCQ